MTDRAILKEETKKHVRALLLSSPMPLVVNELMRDFHTFIGTPLPYQKMGFSHIEDFLRDIQDTVYIGHKNGHMTLQAKADSTTKHIEKLVSKQKVNNRKKYAVSRGGQSRPYNSWSQPPRFSSRPTSGPPPPRPVIPAYIRQQLKQLFKAYTDGLPMTHFEAAFSNRFGSRLNYRKFGFETVENLLRSAPDIVRLQELRGGEWRVLPAFSNPPQPDSNIVTGSSVGGRADSHKRPSKGRGRRRECSGGSSDTRSPDGEGKSAGSVGSSVAEPDQFEDDDSGVSEKLQLEIRQVLEKNPKGVWASQLPILFKDAYGRSFDVHDQGYLSVIDFMSVLPHIAHIHRPDPQGDWLLFDAQIPKSDLNLPEPKVNKQRHPSQKGIEQETREAIQKLLQARPTGILINDFPEMYKTYTGTKLPVEELGFSGPEGLVLSLTDSVLQLTYRGSGRLMVFPINVDIPEVPDVPPAPVPVAQTPSQDRPTDAVGPRCHYTPIILPSMQDFVEIFVSNIVHPGLFWVQLRRKSAAMALENLMDDLEDAYRNSGKKDYKMAESLIVPGQVCATLFPEDNNWHRGIITGLTADGFVEVYYVDYGNTNTVDKSTICYLKQEFLKLPAQAIQARLANIKPIGKKWKGDSKVRLLQLTVNKALVAFITEIRDQVLSLCLTDTNTSFDIHINDLLVDEKYAIFSQDDATTNFTGPADVPEVPDYSFVYGWGNRIAPRMPKTAAGDQQPPTDLPVETQKKDCYVKWVQLTKEHTVHLINVNRTAYVVSAEIASFLWEEDILSSMLKQKRVEVSSLLVSSSDYPDLFEELRRYDVPSLREEVNGTRFFLNLYQLASVPVILKKFDHPDSDLLTAVEELISRFDPDSPFWKSSAEKAPEEAESQSGVDEAPEASVDEVPDAELSYDEQQLTLQALQFKRKRILQLLMKEPTISMETVNELNECETEILRIKKELEDQTPEPTLKPKPKQQPVLDPLFEAMKRAKERQMTSQSIVTMATPESNQTSETLLEGTLRPGNQGVETKASASPADNQSEYPAGTQNLAGRDHSAENQRVIESIMAASTKPIATANIMTKTSSSIASNLHAPQTSILNQANINNSALNQSTMSNNLGNQSVYGVPAGNQFFQTSCAGNQLHQQNSTRPGTGTQPQFNLQTFTQQQRLLNPMFMTQSSMMGAGGMGMPRTGTPGLGGMPNLTGMPTMPAVGGMTGMPGFGGMGGMAGMPGVGVGVMPTVSSVGGMPGMGGMAGVYPGLLPGVSPLVGSNLQGQALMQGGTPSVGRGQAMSQNNLGLLPGLYPLLQNLTVGRGSSGNPGNNSGNR